MPFQDNHLGAVNDSYTARQQTLSRLQRQADNDGELNWSIQHYAVIILTKSGKGHGSWLYSVTK